MERRVGREDGGQKEGGGRGEAEGRGAEGSSLSDSYP